MVENVGWCMMDVSRGWVGGGDTGVMLGGKFAETEYCTFNIPQSTLWVFFILAYLFVIGTNLM